MNEMRFLSSRGAVTAVLARNFAPPLRGALSVEDAKRVVLSLARSGSNPELAGLHRLVTGRELVPAPSRSARDRLRAAIEAALEDGRLLLRAGWGGAGAAPWGGDRRTAGAPTPLGAAIRAVAGARGVVKIDGRRVVFIDSASGRPPMAQREYRPLGVDAARGTLARLAELLPPSEERARAWPLLLAALAPGAGGSPGLVLLRHEPAVAPSRVVDERPAETPSQVAPTRHWVELEIVYDDGTPYDGAFALELPGGGKTSGSPDENGAARFDDLSAGTCKLSFPKLGDADFGPG